MFFCDNELREGNQKLCQVRQEKGYQRLTVGIFGTDKANTVVFFRDLCFYSPCFCQESFNEITDDGEALTLKLAHMFCSEAPDGHPQKCMLMWNHQPTFIFAAWQQADTAPALVTS